jgi:pimeloyl-ACP methyl ester carboxylesterase
MGADDVVLVHGWGGSFAATWEASGFAMLLEDAGKRVIGVDLLGHGTAPRPHDPAAYADLGARVLAALPDRPVAAIGFSLGAATLLDVAVRAPERFDRLLLAGYGAGALSPDEARRQLIADALTAEAAALGDLDPVARLFRQYAHQDGNDVAALVALTNRPAPAPLTDAELALVRCPVLFVIGDRDAYGPAEPLAARLPNADVTVLRNVDHFATTEAYGFVDAALRFVAG